MDGDFINGTTFHLLIFSFFTRERVFHLEIMASFSNHGFSFTKDSYISSSSSDDEIIQEMFTNMNSQKKCFYGYNCYCQLI
jgi:CRISPR/Cas system endoribonuclease Cas6 (RAMP superfamily)